MMRRLGLIVMGLGLVACTRPNPLYGNSGTEGSGDSSSGPATSSADGSSGNTSADASTGIFETDEPGPGYCDLYAINANGELFVIDVDAPEAILVAGPSSLYASRALATHPMSGVLHYALEGNATDIMTVDPVDFFVEREPILFPGENWEPFVRATFEGPALWLGTRHNDRFGVFVPGEPILGDVQGTMTGVGGDLLMLPGEAGLVLTETGTAVLVDTIEAVGATIPINNLGGSPHFTGVARDADDRLWASTLGPSSDLMEIELEPGPEGPSAVNVLEKIGFEISIDDLAPVRVQSGDC